MMLGDHRLLAQLGAGPDGIAYRAERPFPDEEPAEVRVLSGARADSARWPVLLHHLRLAALLHHPGAREVRALAPDHDPPYLVLEWVEAVPLALQLHGRLPLTPDEVLPLAISLAEVLAEAHRLGVVHGGLSPHTVQRTASGQIKLDFTGTLVSPPPRPPAPGVDGPPEATFLWQRMQAALTAVRPGGPGEPPPDSQADVSDPAVDSAGFGALLLWLLTGAPALPGNTPPLPSHLAPDLALLIRELLAAEPADRPPLSDVVARLHALAGLAQQAHRFTPLEVERTQVELVEKAPRTSGGGGVQTEKTRTLAETLPRERLGRFRLLEKIGQGGMGAVYRAVDTSDGSIVAVKVLRVDWARQPQALRRFRKEARLLAEINNPYVTRLLDVNEDAGLHYLALEFVEGKSLERLVEERGRLAEPDALAIMADVARALVDAHAQGIVHRDIKPDNILLPNPRPLPPQDPKKTLSSGGPAGGGPVAWVRAKLSDFGLARHIVESRESLNVTRVGTILGTPLYMSPEQCAGRPLDARADVYSMGATLYHLLAGRPPFLADSPLGLISQHAKEPPPPLRRFNPDVSEGVCRVVEKALAKAPEARYADAASLLRDLERLLRGEPTDIAVHPRRPPSDPRRVLRYEFVWDLGAAPDLLWPYVSNTERLNRAVGLGPVEFSTRAEGNRVRRFGQFRRGGVHVEWEEHPFEWVEGRRLGVLREYRRGPFKWLLNIVDLAPHGTGTRLTQRIEVEPRGLLGRTIAPLEIGNRARRNLERVYRRIDVVAGQAAAPNRAALADPFEEAPPLTRAQRQRLDRLLDDLVARGIPSHVAEHLIEYVAQAPPQEAARIRPLALARRLGLDPDILVAACLHGARAGLLVLVWDILCPVCRIPTEFKDTLRLLKDHERCEACNLDFTLDFANSVELIFRVHPEVRPTELAAYCIGGPAHSPHVAAQTRIAPGERLELELALGEGAYRLRGPQLPFTLDFRVQPGAPNHRLDLPLAGTPDPDLPRLLGAGHQLLVLTNPHSQELVVRVERTASRSDALTAARASSLALFRELFPEEILSPGQLISICNVTLLVTDLDQADALYADRSDAKAFGVIHEHFRLLRDQFKLEGGALVKTVGEGMVAVFPDPLSAVRAGLALQAILGRSEATRDLHLRAGIHRGPALAATLNEQLDYFGTMVRQAMRLPQLAPGGGLVLTQAVAGDPQVAALLRARALEGQLFDAPLPEAPSSLLQRFALPIGKDEG